MGAARIAAGHGGRSGVQSATTASRATSCRSRQRGMKSTERRRHGATSDRHDALERAMLIRHGAGIQSPGLAMLLGRTAKVNQIDPVCADSRMAGLRFRRRHSSGRRLSNDVCGSTRPSTKNSRTADRRSDCCSCRNSGHCSRFAHRGRRRACSVRLGRSPRRSSSSGIGEPD